MFMALATSLVVLFYCCATADIFTNASCFSLLWLYLGNSQVSVYRTIGPTLVLIQNILSTHVSITGPLVLWLGLLKKALQLSEYLRILQ